MATIVSLGQVSENVKNAVSGEGVIACVSPKFANTMRYQLKMGADLICSVWSTATAKYTCVIDSYFGGGVVVKIPGGSDAVIMAMHAFLKDVFAFEEDVVSPVKGGLLRLGLRVVKMSEKISVMKRPDGKEKKPHEFQGPTFKFLFDVLTSACTQHADVGAKLANINAKMRTRMATEYGLRNRDDTSLPSSLVFEMLLRETDLHVLNDTTDEMVTVAALNNGVVMQTTRTMPPEEVDELSQIFNKMDLGTAGSSAHASSDQPKNTEVVAPKPKKAILDVDTPSQSRPTSPSQSRPTSPSMPRSHLAMADGEVVELSPVVTPIREAVSGPGSSASAETQTALNLGVSPVGGTQRSFRAGASPLGGASPAMSRSANSSHRTGESARKRSHPGVVAPIPADVWSGFEQVQLPQLPPLHRGLDLQSGFVEELQPFWNFNADGRRTAFMHPTGTYTVVPGTFRTVVPGAFGTVMPGPFRM